MNKVKASLNDFFICGNCGCLVYEASQEQHDHFENMILRAQPK